MICLAESYTDFQLFDTEPMGSVSNFRDKEDIPSKKPITEKLIHLAKTKSTELVIVDEEEKKVNASNTFLNPQAKARVIESLENEYFCIINSVDYENESITATVYDINDHIQVLDISSNFSEFLETEKNRIVKNASFYWRIGTRDTIHQRLNKSDYRQTKVFSEFRMRLNYVSPRSLKGRLESKVAKYSMLFS